MVILTSNIFGNNLTQIFILWLWQNLNIHKYPVLPWWSAQILLWLSHIQFGTNIVCIWSPSVFTARFLIRISDELWSCRVCVMSHWNLHTLVFSENVGNSQQKHTWEREREANLLVFQPSLQVSILTCSRGDQYNLSNRIGLGELALPNWPHWKMRLCGFIRAGSWT